MKRLDAIVIGGGATGAAVLHALARQGVTRTALFERALPASGTTRLSPGIVRIYHSDWYLANLAVESFPHFQAFKAAVGESCDFVASGSLYFTPQARLARLRQEVGRLNARGGRLEILPACEGAERFPAFQWPPGVVAVYECDSGFVDPVRTTHGWLRSARRGGATVLTGTSAESILLRGNRVMGVRAGGREYLAPFVVVAAGTQSARLVAPLAPSVSAGFRSIQVNRFRGDSRDTAFLRMRGMPAFYDDESRVYGRRWEEQQCLISVDGREALPGDECGEPCPEMARAAQALAAERMPGVMGTRWEGGVRFLESLPSDPRGILGYVPGVIGLVLANGWSGEGLSFLPAVGKRVADLYNQLP